MARTALFERLRLALRLARSPRALPLTEHVEASHAAYLSRRAFVQRAAAAGIVLPVASTLSACGGSADADVGIVGAGLAGLHAAYRLSQRGIRSDVFDAWNRAGGRTFTARGMLDGGQLAELGGELIDTGHATIRALAAELGLTIDDRTEPASIRAETFHIGGRVLSLSEVVTAFEPVAMAMEAALTASEMDAAAFTALDATSIEAWLDDPANGVTEPLRTLLEVAYVGEYGREIGEQSVFNLLWLIDSAVTDPFRIFGDSDEIGHLHDGSESIAEALLSLLPAPPSLEHRLVAMRADGGRTRLVFDRGGSMVERSYAHVILALPFNQLRNVEIDAALGIGEEKQNIIDTLGYGENTKLMLQFTSKPWRTTSMAGGNAFSDNGVQTLWETSIGQAGDQGILTAFAGGMGARALGMGTAESQATRVLPLIDAVFPGTMAAHNGRVLRMDWQAAPFHGGSYTCYLPGQASYSGLEGERAGSIHFAGEHTSIEAQGYMEGAVESGLRVANEILSDLGMAAIEPLTRTSRRSRVHAAAVNARRR